MKWFDCRPPTFFVTGLIWLLLSFLLGIGLLFSMVLGTPLPSFFRLVHVHGALVGGVAQIILGAMTAFIPPLLMSGRDTSDSHPILYASINVGTIGILIGFVSGYRVLVGLAGLLVLFAFLSLLGNAFKQVRSSLMSPPLNLWFYGVAVALLVVGLLIGEGMALRLIDSSSLGKARLAHIHLNLLGFITLTIIGTIHNLFPTILNGRLHSPRLAQVTFLVIPVGVVILVAGFMLTNLWVQIGAGALLMLGTVLFTYNLVRTWMDAGRPGSVAADHLMGGAIFLVLAVGAGALVSVNSLWNPPKLPFGTLHIVGYTHLALIGFILQTIFGALSHLLPVSLAIARVENHKKRGPYLDRLTGIAEQWRAAQVLTLSLGTLGIAVLGSLVWQFPLGSLTVKLTTWLAMGLLLVSFLIFSVKIGALLGARPED